MPAGRERAATPMSEMGAVNLKYLGPDDVHFDVRQQGWDEMIELAMESYELAPAPVKQEAAE
jgi:hypothetical protein